MGLGTASISLGLCLGVSIVAVVSACACRGSTASAVKQEQHFLQECKQYAAQLLRGDQIAKRSELKQREKRERERALKLARSNSRKKLTKLRPGSAPRPPHSAPASGRKGILAAAGPAGNGGGAASYSAGLGPSDGGSCSAQCSQCLGWIKTELDFAEPLAFRWPQRLVSTVLVGVVTSLLAYYVYGIALSDLLNSFITDTIEPLQQQTQQLAQNTSGLLNQTKLTLETLEKTYGLDAEYCTDLFRNVSRFDQELEEWVANRTGGTGVPTWLPNDGSGKPWPEHDD